jgi:hypothetical protein
MLGVKRGGGGQEEKEFMTKQAVRKTAASKMRGELPRLTGLASLIPF